jgi:hypothetical protein
MILADAGVPIDFLGGGGDMADRGRPTTTIPSG